MSALDQLVLACWGDGCTCSDCWERTLAAISDDRIRAVLEHARRTCQERGAADPGAPLRQSTGDGYRRADGALAPHWRGRPQAPIPAETGTAPSPVDA